MNRLLAYSPNLKQSWMLLGIYFLCTIPFGIADIIIKRVVPEWSTLITESAASVFLALIVVRLGKNYRYEPVAAPRQSPLLWPLLALLVLSLNIAVEPLTMWIPMPDWVQQIFTDLFQKTPSAFLLVVIFAPVFEEWLFRGIILKGLLNHYSPKKAIIWSAAFFGIIHLNPWQSVSAFFFGLVVGWVYWRTRSLKLCMFLHAVNNAFSYILSVFIFPDAPVDATIVDIGGGYYVYPAALIACAIAGFCAKKIISPASAFTPQEAVDSGVRAASQNNKGLFPDRSFVRLIIAIPLICIVIGVMFGVAERDALRNKVNQVKNEYTPILIYTDDWHEVSMPLSIDNLHNMGIVFNDEELRESELIQYPGKFQAPMYFNGLKVGELIIDMDTGDIPRISFTENVQASMRGLEMGVSTFQDIINTFGMYSGHTVYMNKQGKLSHGSINYLINDNNNVWFHSDISAFVLDSDDLKEIIVTKQPGGNGIWNGITISHADTAECCK